MAWTAGISALFGADDEPEPSGTNATPRFPRRHATGALGEKARVSREPLRGGAREGDAILVDGVVGERGRVRLAKVEETVCDGVDDELVVAIELLGLVAPRPRPGVVRALRLGQKAGLVLGKELELPPHEVVEAT